MKNWNMPIVEELDVQETAGGWLKLTEEGTHANSWLGSCIGGVIDYVVAGQNPEDHTGKAATTASNTSDDVENSLS